MVSHLNIEIVATFSEPSSSISFSCSLFPFLLLFIPHHHLKGEVTLSAGQDRPVYSERRMTRGWGEWGKTNKKGRNEKQQAERDRGKRGERILKGILLFYLCGFLSCSSLPLSLSSSLPSEVWNLQGSSLVRPNLFTSVTPAVSSRH